MWNFGSSSDVDFAARLHPALLLTRVPERLRVLGAREDIEVYGPFMYGPIQAMQDGVELDLGVAPSFTLNYALLRAPWSSSVRCVITNETTSRGALMGTWYRVDTYGRVNPQTIVCLPPDRAALQVELDRMEGMGMRAWLEEAGIAASDEIRMPEDVTDGDKVGVIALGSGGGQGRITITDGHFSIERQGTTWVIV